MSLSKAGCKFYVRDNGEFPHHFLVLTSESEGYCVIAELVRPIKTRQRYIDLSPRMGDFFERDWDIQYATVTKVSHQKAIEYFEKHDGKIGTILPSDVLELIVKTGFEAQLFNSECREILEKEYPHLC